MLCLRQSRLCAFGRCCINAQGFARRTKHASVRSISLSPHSEVKKDVVGAFPDTYVPSDVESGWYEWWEDCGHLSDDKSSLKATNEPNKKFSMIFPPPNITGNLHLGHALTASIQDALVRWHRAKGFRTQWIPGYDHSGIATQVVIEKKIEAESGRKRNSVNKEELLANAQEWKNEKVTTIKKQLKCLGPLLNWNQECYTLDKNFSNAVTEAFVQLFEMGLISRREGLVNWCCHLQSAISDIEVNYVSVDGGSTLQIPGSSEPVDVGQLTFFLYEFENSRNRSETILVATSRPETILGDVALAVNPTDTRYTRFIGQRVVHPFDGRLLPVIADARILKDFGTGVVKITPAHDHLDFEIAKTHDLPLCSIFDKEGRVLPEFPRFAGLNRFAARKSIIQELVHQKLLIETKKQSMSIPVCSRSGDIIEPMLRPQWYLDCDEMFNDLTKDIKHGQFNVQPESSKAILLDWLSYKRKWCISRQLWWGHQIPAYTIINSESLKVFTNDNNDVKEIWFVGRTPQEVAEKASVKLKTPVAVENLRRDPDVLDTWFSSALFPFVVCGWPKLDNSIFESFYPLSLMETGHDIIFFWVARMAILGKKLTNQRPFSNVLVHGLICDSQGRKMSKSLGNVVDPFDVIQGRSITELHQRAEKSCSEGYISRTELAVSKKGLSRMFPNGFPQCGADALRFALLSHNIKSQYINVDVGYVHNCSKFCNKIWQACRFYMKISDETGIPAKPLSEVADHLSSFDRWILSKLATMISNCDDNWRIYDLHVVTSALRKFWYSSLCDVYLEGVKPLAYDPHSSFEAKQAVISTLLTCIRTGIISIAPIMPFLAEELYQRLKLGTEGTDSIDTSVICEPYPDPETWQKWLDSDLETAFQNILYTASELRTMRINYNIIKISPEVHIKVPSNTLRKNFEKFHLQLETLSGCKLLSFTDKDIYLEGHVRRLLNDSMTIYFNVQHLINPEDVLVKLKQRLAKLNKELDRKKTEAMSPKYIMRVSKEAHLKDCDRINVLEEDIRTLERSLTEILQLSSTNVHI